VPATSKGADGDSGAGPGAPRHQQRERALSLLYEAELKGESPSQVLDALPVKPDAYVRTLLKVELAKTYSTDDSGSFVNGILSTIADDVRPA
jgi:transcription termination factor NusB